jgi:hypothetical protein
VTAGSSSIILGPFDLATVPTEPPLIGVTWVAIELAETNATENDPQCHLARLAVVDVSATVTLNADERFQLLDSVDQARKVR